MDNPVLKAFLAIVEILEKVGIVEFPGLMGYPVSREKVDIVASLEFLDTLVLKADRDTLVTKDLAAILVSREYLDIVEPVEKVVILGLAVILVLVEYLVILVNQDIVAHLAFPDIPESREPQDFRVIRDRKV